MLGVCVSTTLRASLSGTLFQRKDVVNQCLEFVLCQDRTPSIVFRHSPPKEGCRKPVLGVWVSTTLRASLSGTFLQRKDVVNQCLESGSVPHSERFPAKEGCRKPVLGVCISTTLQASLSGTFLQRKDVVNQCLEFVSVCISTTLRASLSGTFLQRKDVINQCLEFVSGPHSEHRFPAPSSKGRMS